MDDLDIDELHALPDNRKSKFFKMSTQEKFIRILAFIVILTINYNQWLNIHNPDKFIFGAVNIPKINLIPKKKK